MSKMRNVYPSKRDMNLAMREKPQTNRPPLPCWQCCW